MPYCPKCGVQVDPNIDKCPLCSVFIPKYDQSNGVAERRYPLRDEKKPSFTNRQIRLLIWGILSILFVMSFLILLTTNLVQAGEITWGRYYLAAIGLCWIYLTLILLCLRLPSFIILGIYICR